MNLKQLNILINIIIPTIFLIVGNIGNILTLIIFKQKDLKNYSTSIYFYGLALADIFALNIEILINFYLPTLVNYFGKNELELLRSHSDSLRNNIKFVIIDLNEIQQTLGNILCKLHSLTFYTAYEISSWLLVLLSLDRYLSIVKPCYKEKLCKPRIARLVTRLVCTIIIIFNTHGFWFVQFIEVSTDDGTINKTRTYLCGVNSTRYPIYYEFYHKHWNTFNFILSTAIPLILLAWLNFNIFLKMRYSIKRLKACKYKLTICYFNRINKYRQMNLILISAVIAFCLFYAPYSIYFIIEYNFDVPVFKNSNVKIIVEQLLLLWSMLNVTLNFYLYYLSGSTLFNVEFKKLCKIFQ